jgi:hypothetical protein
MPVSDWVPIASVAASALVGFGVPYVVTRHERRDLRADVLRHVGDIERLRWAPTEWDEFRKAVFALRGAALVAGADREIVDRYIFLAAVARRESDADWAINPYPAVADEPGGGGISVKLGDLVSDAATMLAEHLWHPLRNSRRVARLLAASRVEERRLRSEPGERFGRSIDWSPLRF